MRQRLTKLLFFIIMLTSLSAYAAGSLHVKLIGVPSKIKSAVRSSMSIVQYPDYALSAAIKMQATFQEGIKQIKAALNNYGYFSAKAHGKITYSAANKTWFATYYVDIGKPLKITQADITIVGAGQHQRAFQALIDQSHVKTGNVLTNKAYEDLKDHLQRVANDLGYFDAKLVKHQIIINIDTYTAKVILQLNTGVRYKFGRIAFIQNPNKLSTPFLKRFPVFKAGVYYNQIQVDQLQRDLNNSNYFTTVNVMPKPDKKTKTVPIKATLIPQKPFQYGIGIGYGTDTGVRGMLGWKWRFASRSGQYIKALAQISEIYQLYNINYVIPGKRPLFDNTTIGFTSNQTDVTTYSATQYIAGINVTRRFHRWQWKFGLDQHYIRFSTNANNNDTNVKYLTPNGFVSYTRRFSRPQDYWNNGYKFTFALTGTIKNPIFSSTSFIQGTAQGRQSFNLSKDNRIFFRQLLGTTAVSNFSKLSPTYRFYIGDLSNVRGIDYFSLGPANGQGNVTGGRNLVVSNINLEHHFFGNWSGLIFYDIGSAFNQPTKLTFYSSVGVGISWRSPLGPLNVYLAHPINVPGQSLGFDISIGKFI